MNKKFATYSELDSRGKPVIDCSECERGGNGSDKDKCSCGWQITTGGHGACFLGTLIEGLEIRR